MSLGKYTSSTRHLPGPEVGQSYRLHCEKGPAEAVLPSPAEEVQPATGAADNSFNNLVGTGSNKHVVVLDAVMC